MTAVEIKSETGPPELLFCGFGSLQIQYTLFLKQGFKAMPALQVLIARSFCSKTCSWRVSPYARLPSPEKSKSASAPS